jgi:hypothetical protein
MTYANPNVEGAFELAALALFARPGWQPDDPDLVSGRPLRALDGDRHPPPSARPAGVASVGELDVSGLDINIGGLDI